MDQTTYIYMDYHLQCLYEFQSLDEETETSQVSFIFDENSVLWVQNNMRVIHGRIFIFG